MERLDYFDSIQTSIEPYMRKIIVEWMLEVCEDSRSEVPVFLVAVNCLDRFLCLKNIEKHTFQRIAVACLWIASKFVSDFHLSLELLILYTAKSVTKSDIIRCEKQILSELNWEIPTTTIVDSLNLLLLRFGHVKDNTVSLNMCVKLAEKVATTDEFILKTPSFIATACFTFLSKKCGVQDLSIVGICECAKVNVEHIRQTYHALDKL